MANGKAKGGNYEHVVIGKLQKAFKVFGIEDDDIFRTKNSGSTKKQPGDVQFSPAMAKLFPALVECKHYKKIEFKLGKSISQQPKSYVIKQWWKQVEAEQKCRPDKIGLLVFRQNNCPDMVCLTLQNYMTLCGRLKWGPYKWLLITMYKDKTLVMLPFKEFLNQVIACIKRRRKK